MVYRYFVCDVFTKQMFRGNQLAVLPEAQGLSESQMQNIAKEFNFSETTFVFPPEAGQTKMVRIYTPNSEVPFAGHPNIGTAFILAKNGVFGTLDTGKEVVFEEKAGLVPIKIKRDESGYIWCELSAPEVLSIRDPVSKSLVASVLTLNESEILTTTHPPQVASVGLPFLLVELSSVNSLVRAQIDISKLKLFFEKAGVTYIHLYCRNVEDFDIKARMFAPLDGVSEDPATGSANCALIGLLSQYENIDDFDKNWTISQGAEIGRPSVLYGRTQKQKGKVVGVWIGGHSVLVSEGTLKL